MRAMEYALHAAERPDGRLFEVGVFTQRLAELAGDHAPDEADEVLYVLSGGGRARFGSEEHELRPGVAAFVPAGTAWTAEGDARALSVLVHDPEPGAGPATVDLGEVERGTATAPEVAGPRTARTLLSATYFWASDWAGVAPCSTGVSPVTSLTFRWSFFAHCWTASFAQLACSFPRNPAPPVIGVTSGSVIVLLQL
jgi:quercetin dioxygenase-like cupin family protein